MTPTAMAPLPTTRTEGLTLPMTHTGARLLRMTHTEELLLPTTLTGAQDRLLTRIEAPRLPTIHTAAPLLLPSIIQLGITTATPIMAGRQTMGVSTSPTTGSMATKGVAEAAVTPCSQFRLVTFPRIVASFLAVPPSSLKYFVYVVISRRVICAITVSSSLDWSTLWYSFCFFLLCCDSGCVSVVAYCLASCAPIRRYCLSIEVLVSD